MNGKPNRAVAVYCDYEDADEEQVGAMKHIIARNGGEVVGERGGEDEGEYRIVFRYATEAEFGKIEAEGEDEGWEVYAR